MVLAGLTGHTAACPIRKLLNISETSPASSLPDRRCHTCDVDLDAIASWDADHRFAKLFELFHDKAAMVIASEKNWRVSDPLC